MGPVAAPLVARSLYRNRFDSVGGLVSPGRITRQGEEVVAEGAEAGGRCQPRFDRVRAGSVLVDEWAHRP